MPVNIDVYDFKCFNQLRNGEDFTLNTTDFTKNLVGNIGEKVKVTYSVNIGQTAFTQDLEEWEIFNDPAIREIRRASGSFLEDAIQVGDRYTFYNDWENRKTISNEYSGQVEFISSDGKTLKYSIVSGTDSTNGTAIQNVGLVFNQINSVNSNSALFLKFGLIGNEETFNYLSKTTGAQQVYYTGDMEAGTIYNSESLGSIKDWVSGSVTVEYLLSSPDLGEVQYDVTHEFIINPFYILSFRQFINNGTIPELLEGDSSIKYAAELEFRKTLANTGSSKSQDFQNLNGFVGWYGENFNGLNSKYQIESITYQEDVSGDPLEGININLATKAIITISNIDGPITDYSCGAYIIRVPNSEDEYIGTTTNLIDNFLYKSETLTSPATSGTNITSSLIGGNLVIEYTIDYTASERLKLSTDDEFLLFVQVEDPTISLAGNSNRVMLIADLNNYVDIDFLSGFLNFPKYEFLQHPQNLGEEGSIVQVLSNEDGILLDALIGSDLTKNVVINGLKFQLLAYNELSNESFLLDEYIFNLGDPIFTNGSQQIDINTTRGYNLKPGDDFNLARITTETISGNFQQYSIQLGQKIKWQDWIFNPNVDSVFFDATQPNNNQNFKSSNYSGNQDYTIRLALIANVSGIDDLNRNITGNVINYGTVLTVEDYNESEDSVTGFIQTFDLETNQSLEGNILYNGKDTLFRAVFQNASGMQYAIHRIEPSQSQGDGIEEMSSIVPPLASLLKPLSGETQLRFNLVGTDLTTECLIDGGSIQEGVNYKLSARTGKIPLNLLNGFTFTINTNNPGVSNSDEFQLPFVLSGTYDVIIDKGNGDSFVEVNTWDDPATLLDYSSTGAGIYQVKIYGLIRGWAFDNGGDRLKITDISQWGVFQPNNVVGAFHGCSNLDVTATDIIDLSATTDLNSFFKLCTSLTYSNGVINNWDISGITNLSEMFNACPNFNQDLNLWDVSNVTNLSRLFRGCSTFNSNVTNWNVSACTTFFEMFFSCFQFDQDLSNWVPSAATNFRSFFQNCNSFNTSIDAWGASTGNVTDMANMFNSCDVYNQTINSWDTSNVNNISGMFRDCPAFNQNLNSLNMLSVTAANGTFLGATSFNGNIGNWFTGAASVNNFTDFMNNCESFNQDISSWDVSNVTAFRNMFANADAFNQNISGWDVSSGTNFNGMFTGVGMTFNQPIGSWNVQNMQSCSTMFALNTAFDQDLGAWDIQSLTDATDMFASVSISQSNYDSLLIGWESNIHNSNVVFSGGTSNYTLGGSADTARTNLILLDLWSITDGGGV